MLSEKKERIKEEKAAKFERLCEVMQDVLSDKIEKVVVSNR